MDKVPILLLRPAGDQPSSVDQSLGARLAATQGPLGERIVLEEDSFRAGELDELEQVVHRWRAKVLGVVGATDVAESTRLGELTERFNVLCFVSNNNPAVWRRRPHTFHIGVPTAMTAALIAQKLLCDVGVKRVYILHDKTEFQTGVAQATASLLERDGAEVRCHTGADGDWLDDVRSWNPELVYLVYSNETLALPLVGNLRLALPKTRLLLGRSLLRQGFIAALRQSADGALFVDLFHRSALHNKQEEIFFNTCAEAKIELPTANHGFGWDAMTLCGLALARSDGNTRSAIEYLESGVELEGATGRYRFSAKDHNGRYAYNPTTLSWIHKGRLKMYEPRW